MNYVKLPWELVEEILYRVHQPRSLIRFKIVCKQWNKLFETRSFVNNHLVHARPQLLFWNDSKMYSVNVTLNDDPKLEMFELSSEIPLQNFLRFLSCDGLLLGRVWSLNQKAVVLNPWLRQSRWIELQREHSQLHGIGYDSDRPEKSLEIVGSSLSLHGKSMKFDYVSLNGNLYWIISHDEIHKYAIRSFDFSKEIFGEALCVLPWDEIAYLFLSTFRKDGLSVLKKFITTDNIEIWVTKNKVNIDDGKNITWMKFMSFSEPISYTYPPSYFIDDSHKKTLVMCCADYRGKLFIYIVRGNAVKKIFIGLYRYHCSYFPSLVPVP